MRPITASCLWGCASKPKGDSVLGVKRLAENRKARHDYFIEETYEAGLRLCGTEVKSLRAGTANLKDSFCAIKNGEIFAHNFHISPYEKGNIFNRDPIRPKKLLMHKREINRLFAKVSREGYALIPLSVYLKDSLVKMELALAKGKKLYDKREADAKKQAERDMERHLKR
ncbi:MAG: SsrA-binding protein SmpB [Oscillospiraceae bacterium]|nr:SsrA-binding protein SmpB [Oscillospiraceae bacterium]